MANEYRFSVDGRIPVLKVHHEPRPGPAVVLMHGLGSSADVQRKELHSLADHGLAAVGVDAPHHGARRDSSLDELMSLGPPEFHLRMLRLICEAAGEISRVVDHLLYEGHGPIALTGISLGAYTALAVATVDPRIRATVSILGSPDWTPRDGWITDEIRDLMRFAPVHRPAECARNPLLLFNASRDVHVPAHWSRSFTRMLHEQHPGLGAHVGYFEYPDSDHFMRPQDWDDLWGRTIGFLRHHLA